VPQRSELKKTHMASTADACRRLVQACERADFAGAVQLMREHASSAAVQLAGCEALLPITGGADDAPCFPVVAAGALDAVLAALAMHREDALLQATCFALLCNVARPLYGASSVLSTRAVEAAVAALLAHPAVPIVQIQGCKVLTALTFRFDDSGTRVTASAGGAIEAVVAALVAHEADFEVQAAACRALRNLIHEIHAYALRASAAGAEVALTAALRAHPACADVQGSGCAAVASKLGRNAPQQHHTIGGCWRGDPGGGGAATARKFERADVRMQRACMLDGHSLDDGR
jgi:hypothetical protein